MKPKIACLLGEDFEDSELELPRDRLIGAGFDVEVIGARAGAELRGKRGEVTERVEKSIDSANPEDYAALFIPGGYSPDHIRADRRFVDFVLRFEALKRPVAAICHGPQLLITAGLVRGRRLTAWTTIQDDLRQVGANVQDAPVVVDGNWITSRKPDDIEIFSQTFIKALQDRRFGQVPGR